MLPTPVHNFKDHAFQKKNLEYQLLRFISIPRAIFDPQRLIELVAVRHHDAARFQPISGHRYGLLVAARTIPNRIGRIFGFANRCSLWHANLRGQQSDLTVTERPNHQNLASGS